MNLVRLNKTQRVLNETAPWPGAFESAAFIQFALFEVSTAKLNSGNWARLGRSLWLS